MIPKIIHYCWFGGNAKPELVKKCINSWKIKCPDYQIVEWNEDNFDMSINTYAQEAYQSKKWAFVTDYARLWIVYNYGGIYLDTDVELIKSLDSLLDNKAFFGFEDSNSVNTGLGFGSVKNNSIVKCMLDAYENIHFINSDGSFDKLPCPIRNTKSIAHLFPENFHANKVLMLDDATIYPPDYFCPLSSDGMTMKKTKNTYSIHWFTASWLNEDEMIVHEYRVFRNKCIRYFGEFFGGHIVRGVYLFFPKKRSVLKRM